MENINRNSIKDQPRLGQFANNRFFVLFFLGVSILAGGGIGFLIVSTSKFFVLWMLFGAISAIIFLYKIEYGVLAMIFVAYTYTSNVLIVNYGLPSIMKPLIGILIFTIFIRWALFGEKPDGWQRSFLLISGYGLIGLGSFFYAKDVSVAKEWLSDYVKDAIIAIVISIVVQRLITFRRLVWVLLAAGIFLGSLTTYQALTGTFENTYWGFSKAVRGSIVGESNDWRSGGPGFGPNGFAQIMLILVPFAMDRFWNEKNINMRILAGWALMVCVLSVFYTYSRSAFLGLIAVLALMMIYRRVKLSTMLLTIFLLGVLQVFVPAKYADRLLTLVDLLPGSGANPVSEDSFRGRISENLAAWRMFMDHPLLGVGLHNYGVNYQTYSREIGLDPRREERTPHNFFLEIASEMGFIGLSWLGIFLWVVIRGLRQARKDLKNIGLHEYDGLIVATAISILGFLIISLYQHLAYPRYFWMLFGIALAIPNLIRKEIVARQQIEFHETR
jgi:putative inorganic carbon (hco3(-)) transporter